MRRKINRCPLHHRVKEMVNTIAVFADIHKALLMPHLEGLVAVVEILNNNGGVMAENPVAGPYQEGNDGDDDGYKIDGKKDGDDSGNDAMEEVDQKDGDEVDRVVASAIYHACKELVMTFEEDKAAYDGNFESMGEEATCNHRRDMDKVVHL